jgi:cytochrome P450
VTHLNGIIYEALRLHPPIPSGLLRVTPPEGISFEGVYIPGGVTVSVPTHPLGRCEMIQPHLLYRWTWLIRQQMTAETAYARSHDFIPERWYSQPELIRDKNAFVSFSSGK